MDILNQLSQYKAFSWLKKVSHSAITEMIIFLIVMTVIDMFFFESTRFYGVDPHPFWVIILLISVQYGVNEGIICTILCTALLLMGGIPEQKITESSYQYLYNISITPLLWLATTVVLGELSRRNINKRKELELALIQSKKEEQTITKAYSQLKELKEALEIRLAGELKSLLAVFEAVKPLESNNKNLILMASEDVIRSIVNPRKYSLYVLGETGLEPVLCNGWEEGDSYQRRFNKDSDLYKTIIGEKRVLSVINHTDEKILANEGVVAGPIIDTKSGEIYGIVKIEDNGFMELNIQNIETFKVLCEWIGMSYAKAKEYQTMTQKG